MPAFTYDTPFANGASLADTVRRVDGKTALVFLRYYGCPLCQYEIHQFAVEHDRIAATGGQMLVVLQSSPERLAAQLTPESLPFDIICDPDQRLYKDFEIAPASSEQDMVRPEDMPKLAQVEAAGFKHGEYEGDELQLPATFIVDGDLNIDFVRYCETIGQTPDPAELAELLR